MIIFLVVTSVVIEGIEKTVDGMNPINDVELITSSLLMNNDVYYIPTSVCP